MPERTSANPASAAIAVEHLSHRYRGADRAALEDVSLTVGRGEIFGILGPNGGGKTTLFRVLSTLMRPTEATRNGSAAGGVTQGAALHIFGRDVLREPAAVRRLLGVVFQQPSLDGKLTAEENLRHAGRLYGLGGATLEQRITDWLTRFGLADRRHERTERFSGGQRRRVELAKALLHEPRLLLMDEPATGLDPAARRELWRHLTQLREQRGVTVVLTTHLMDEADRCDRLAILAGGRLLAVDRPDRLKAQIGGDVVTLEPAVNGSDFTAQTLAQRITDRFGPWDVGSVPQVVDGRVRFEKPDGAAVVAAIASAWPGHVRRFTVGQPTLEDVFLHLTGSAFEASAAPEANNGTPAVRGAPAAASAV